MADNNYSVEAAEVLANEALHLPILEAVPIYEQLLATFPTAAKYWKQYVEAHMAVNNDDATKQLFSRCLLNCFQIPLWYYLLQSHILELRCIPEALPYFVTPKAVDENSSLLQQLPHWTACSITQALEFLTPSYKGHPRVMAYVLRVLESYPPERVTFFMPQLVQALRYDEEQLVEGYLLRATQRSDIFAHILIWHLQGETIPESGKDEGSGK